MQHLIPHFTQHFSLSSTSKVLRKVLHIFPLRERYSAFYPPFSCCMQKYGAPPLAAFLQKNTGAPLASLLQKNTCAPAAKRLNLNNPRFQPGAKPTCKPEPRRGSTLKLISNL